MMFNDPQSPRHCSPLSESDIAELALVEVSCLFPEMAFCLEKREQGSYWTLHCKSSETAELSLVSARARDLVEGGELRSSPSYNDWFVSIASVVLLAKVLPPDSEARLDRDSMRLSIRTSGEYEEVEASLGSIGLSIYFADCRNSPHHYQVLLESENNKISFSAELFSRFGAVRQKRSGDDRELTKKLIEIAEKKGVDTSSFPAIFTNSVDRFDPYLGIDRRFVDHTVIASHLHSTEDLETESRHYVEADPINLEFLVLREEAAILIWCPVSKRTYSCKPTLDISLISASVPEEFDKIAESSIEHLGHPSSLRAFFVVGEIDQRPELRARLVESLLVSEDGKHTSDLTTKELFEIALKQSLLAKGFSEENIMLVPWYSSAQYNFYTAYGGVSTH